MAVLNKRAIVTAIEMYGVTAIRLPSTLGTNLNQLIKSLFANGEQGFAYDPNDLSTMFQDSAGTTPVTGAGQAVGLMLDKSKGLVLGNEMVTNGDFSAGTSGWNLPATCVVSNGAVIATNMPTGVGPYQLSTPVLGSLYKVSFTISNYASGSIYATLFNTDDGPIVSSNGTFTCFIRKRNTGVNAVGLAALSNFTGTIDNISFKELAGNHAYQTTSASRPILRKNAVTGANYLEFDGSDDFFVTNSIDFTATDKVSLFAGVRKMSATAVNMLCELSSSSTETAQANAFYLAVPETSTGTIFFRSRAIQGGGHVATVASGSGVRNCVITAKSDIPNDLNTIRLDGVSGIPSTADLGVGNLGNYPLFIGRRGGTSLPFNGHLYSLIGIGRLTTDDEIASIEKELAKRTGVTLSV